MAVVPTDRIRNVLMLGHTGTGKSTLAEAMLRAGSGDPNHGDHAVRMDHDPEELERGHSLMLALASIDFEGHKINVLDAPGGAEVIGDAYPALLAADTAVFVVDATVGVQPQHVELWRACEARGMPRIVFLNRLDLERARYQERIDDLAQRYGTPLAPVHMPLGIGAELRGVIDLLHGVEIQEHDGRAVEQPIPDEHLEQAAGNRERLVEAIVETDDELLERYLDGEQPTAQELAPRFADGVARCRFFPVLCGSATRGVGIRPLLRFLVEECPSPALNGPLPTDGATVAYVAKTFSDQYVGRINVLRVFAGQVRPDDALQVRRTRGTERIRNLFSLRGGEHVPVDGATAGDIVAVSKVNDLRTGDVLFAGDDAPDLDVPTPPEGFHRVVLAPTAPGDEAKLADALHRVLEEDPSIRITLDPDSQTRVLSFLGPLHVDVTVSRLAHRYGVSVVAEPAPVTYRETIRRPASGTGRHVKQTGGHGQYGIVSIELEPRPRDAGFEFTNVSVGGVVPSSYVPSVEKGLLEAMRQGPLGGFQVVDVGVRLVDGKHHPVDSSDAAFQMAGILAFRDAVAKADPVLLEPIVAVSIEVPDELTGAILADLSSRRGRITGTSVTDDGWSRVEALVPDAELASFPADFRAITGGKGQVGMTYDHHEDVPDSVARRVLEGRATG